MLFVLPIGFGLCLSGIICLIRWLQEDTARFFFIGLDGMRWPLAIGLVVCIGFLFACIWLRLSRTKILAVLTVMILFGIAFQQAVRIDGYYGNRTPRFIWSWTPTAEQEVKTYFTSMKSKKKTSLQDDLFRTSQNDFDGLLGGDRTGHINAIGLISDWKSSQPKLLWRHPVGLGWSSMAVVGDVAISLEQRDDYECVVCYGLRLGNELWCHQEKTRFKHEYGDGPRSTPTVRAGRVLSMGATGVLTCLDLPTGQLQWKDSVFNDSEKENLLFGTTSSPLVVDDRVIVTPGAGTNASAICYAMSSGEKLWRSGDDPASYASPAFANLVGTRQVLSFNGAGLRSYGLDGESLWFHPWVTQGESRVNVAQPIVVASDRDGCAEILISSGYDRGTALIKISRIKDAWSSEVLWTSNHLKSKLSNIVTLGGYVYGLDNGLLTCIDLADGQRRWKRGRYGHGKLLLVGDKLLIQAESGEVVLVSADPTVHRELTRFQALESKTWNYPTLAGNVLVVRNDREAAAYELPVE